jgi:hypothetical protein
MSDANFVVFTEASNIFFNSEFDGANRQSSDGVSCPASSTHPPIFVRNAV